MSSGPGSQTQGIGLLTLSPKPKVILRNSFKVKYPSVFQGLPRVKVWSTLSPAPARERGWAQGSHRQPWQGGDLRLGSLEVATSVLLCPYKSLSHSGIHVSSSINWKELIIHSFSFYMPSPMRLS